MSKKRKKAMLLPGDRASRRLRVVQKVDSVMENYLKQEAGWDGMYPIAIRLHQVKEGDFKGVNSVFYLSSRTIWVNDIFSAYRLFCQAYFLEMDAETLAMRSDLRAIEKTLRQEAGWDGFTPIPLKWNGSISSLSDIEILHTSGDDHCVWVRDAVSAHQLFRRGFELESDGKILVKRETFNV